jgi:hypothetical protein
MPNYNYVHSNMKLAKSCWQLAKPKTGGKLAAQSTSPPVQLVQVFTEFDKQNLNRFVSNFPPTWKKEKLAEKWISLPSWWQCLMVMVAT